MVQLLTNQPRVPDYDRETRVWPASLPPPLPEEDTIDRDLVMLIRNGSLALEDEDALVLECIKVYQAHRMYDPPAPVWWKAPQLTNENWWDPDYEVGYELMFINEGDRKGQPVGILVRSRQQAEFQAMYTKEVPRSRWIPKPIVCPLTIKSSKFEEYRRMGIPACEVDGFSNAFLWTEHVQKVHEDLVASLQAFSPGTALADLLKDAREDGEKWRAMRRASDPRLKEALAPTE